MGVLVEPKPGSYVTEWEAVQFDPNAFGKIKVLMRNSPWSVQLLVEGDIVAIVIMQIHNGTVERWDLKLGDWIVKSPHGRYWFMSHDEFQSQFEEVAE